jgi:BirA family transcriptional regulator, biotin operon repressor / biotin---[acetyl-CoA-carboxylase] ligase
MSNSLLNVVELLSDHQFHDGTSIGEALNVTRAAVWKIIKKLEAYDIPIKSVKGKGYILEEPLILLDAKKIKSGLRDKTILLEILEKTASTNDDVKQLSHKNKNPIICIAEMQTQGRGRFNRNWHSPFGKNVYFSMLYRLPKDISELSGLSLIIALATCKAIEAACQLPEPLSVKWPNDIVASGKKVGGILIEIQAESNGFCNIVIGIGLNVNMQKASKSEINQQWTSIQNLSGHYEDRNRLCSELITYLISYLQRFNEQGLSDFLDEWNKRDSLLNQLVHLTSNNEVISGTGAGINEQGHLMLTLPGNIKKAFASGDTSLLKQ